LRGANTPRLLPVLRNPETDIILDYPLKPTSGLESRPTINQIRQAAALPVVTNEDGEPRVVMVTSRGSGRWILPKGNLIAGLAPHDAARREALEEAGVIGRIKKKSLGTYTHWKQMDGLWVLATVMVFPMKVERRIDDYKEAGQRQVLEARFFDAVENVCEPGLKEIIRAYGERKVKTPAIS
jgi:8-oxo-dGTP pyrophosphatase MutT (NUDIX family)